MRAWGDQELFILPLPGHMPRFKRFMPSIHLISHDSQQRGAGFSHD